MTVGHQGHGGVAVAAPIGGACDDWSRLLRDRNVADVDAALLRLDQRKVHRGALPLAGEPEASAAVALNATPSGTREPPERYTFNSTGRNFGRPEHDKALCHAFPAGPLVRVFRPLRLCCPDRNGGSAIWVIS